MAARCRGAASRGAAAPSRPVKRSWGRGEPQALSPGWERDGSGMGVGWERDAQSASAVPIAAAPAASHGGQRLPPATVVALQLAWG